jgi:hypothetical protein
VLASECDQKLVRSDRNDARPMIDTTIVGIAQVQQVHELFARLGVSERDPPVLVVHDQILPAAGHEPHRSAVKCLCQRGGAEDAGIASGTAAYTVEPIGADRRLHELVCVQYGLRVQETWKGADAQDVAVDAQPDRVLEECLPHTCADLLGVQNQRNKWVVQCLTCISRTKSLTERSAESMKTMSSGKCSSEAKVRLGKRSTRSNAMSISHEHAHEECGVM